MSPCEVLEVLIASVNNSGLDRKSKRPLIATLKAACTAFDRGDCVAAINQLHAFQNKVRAQLTGNFPAEAAEFGRLAQKIANCTDCPVVDAGGS